MRITSLMSPFNVSPSVIQQTQRAIARSLERLSSGSRVAEPRDDIAAYALGTRLDTQVRGLRQAQLNISSAVGAVETADNAIANQMDLLQQIRDIASQATSSFLSTSDRAALNSTLDSLMKEFSRITSDTSFNGQKLLDGTFSDRILQIGANTGDRSTLSIGNLTASKLFLKDVGNGSFAAAKTYKTISGTSSDIRSIDVNKDGFLDIIKTNDITGAISVQLGRGDGTFNPDKTYAATSGANHFDVGDLNNDGNIDIVVAGSGGARILLGNGDGSFSSQGTIAGTNVRGVTIGDFNHDSKNDLTIVIDDGSATLVTRLGNGDGTFAAGVSTSEVGASSGIDVRSADLNGDGNIDLVRLDSGYIKVYLGNGDGTFGNTASYYTSPLSSNIKFADMNHDGKIDIVSAGIYGGTISFGVGDGTFINNGTSNFFGNTSVGSEALGGFDIGDFNGDGRMDIIAADYGNTEISVWWGDNVWDTGARVAAVTLADSGTSADIVTVGDYNRDGVLDFASNRYVEGDNAIHIGSSVKASAAGSVRVNSASDAAALLNIVDSTMTKLQSERANLAAIHSRLDVSAQNNLLLSDTFSEAKSKALDVDMAVEVAELVRNQILAQAQMAVAAQANVQMQIVLNLLKPY